MLIAPIDSGDVRVCFLFHLTTREVFHVQETKHTDEGDKRYIANDDVENAKPETFQCFVAVLVFVSLPCSSRGH